jgi:hypothetical protein
MITFTLSTKTNLFGKDKLIVEIMEKNPWYVRHMMERSRAIVLDYELARRIMWMFPQGTNRDADFILELNEQRLNGRNKSIGELIGRRRQAFACDGERIKFNHHRPRYHNN